MSGPVFVFLILFGPGLPVLLLVLLCKRRYRDRQARRWRAGKRAGPQPVP